MPTQPPSRGGRRPTHSECSTAPYDIVQHGAIGDGATNDAPAIQRAIDACAAAGGGRVVIPAGRVFRCGPIRLASHVDLHVERGSQLEAIPDRSLCTEFGLTPRLAVDDGSKWIHAEDAEFVALSGGVDWMGREEKAIFRTPPGRPFMVHFENCRNVSIRDVTLRDAPFWTVHLLGCENVLVQGISILNNLKVPNSDGINPDRCKNVRIANCHVEAADDCICLKSEEARHEERYGACENVVVTGCTLVSTSCAIKIGTGTFGVVRHVVVSDCVISRGNRGVGLVMRDGGSISDALFSNLVIETRFFDPAWWGAAEPIYVTAFPRKAGMPSGTIENVRFANISCRSENGVYVAAADPSAIRGVAFDSVRVALKKTSRYPGGFFDRRPTCLEGPEVRATSGFCLVGATDVTLRNCEVAWGETAPDYYRHAVDAENIRGLRIEGLRGTAYNPNRDAAVSTKLCT